MLKKIALLPLFTCLAVGLLSGCGSESRGGSQSANASTVRSIERVLHEDAKTCDGVDSVADVVVRMRAIDLSGCPADFKVAYVQHIYAWGSMAEVERQAVALENEYNSAGACLEAFLRGLLGDPLGKAIECNRAYQQLQSNYDLASNRIRDTFQRVESIAVTYDANIARQTH